MQLVTEIQDDCSLLILFGREGKKKETYIGEPKQLSLLINAEWHFPARLQCTLTQVYFMFITIVKLVLLPC
jgi:hypothetical protein